VFGIIMALSGIHHGIFEVLQGNKETPCLIIQAISPEFQRWDNGEEAFTLIPNFLVTGICSIIIGTAIILWSMKGLQTKYGRIIFLILFVLLTLCGGGIGYTIFFLSVWIYGTRMNKPLIWWRKVLKGKLINSFARVWFPLLIIAALFFIIALEISVFGFPGINADKTILQICWSSLFASFILMHITYILGFVYDIQNLEEG
jgi:hypothetical protein